MKIEESFVLVKKSDGMGGTVAVEGAKNAVLPILPALLLARGVSTLYNVPPSQDVYLMIELLQCFGLKISFCPQTKVLVCDASSVEHAIPPASLFQSMRASTLLAGPLVGKMGVAWIGSPGGDNIGKRPINFHLEAFSELGVTYKQKDDHLVLFGDSLHGGKIFLDYPSVGATQNVLLLAASIDDTTIIYNAAQEPEILDLVEVLEKMGAKVTSMFGGTLIVRGNSSLKSFEHTIMPDRLEAGTLLMAAAATKGSIHIVNAPAFAMQHVLKKLGNMGHKISVGHAGFGVTLDAAECPISTNIKTMPYPGYPTDLQSPIMTLLSVTPGNHKIHETVFESRMKHAYELNKMGARIAIEYDHANIVGVNSLYGTDVVASDIRACSALILAGLVAEGSTRIFGVHHLLRGHAGLDAKMRTLGADISIVCNYHPSSEVVSAAFSL